MEPLKRFLILVAGVWLLAWLPIGLWMGDLDYVLTSVSRDTQARQLYQGLLYSGLLIVFLDSWRRQAPQRPAWGRLRDFPLYAVFGLASALVLRVVLVALGARVWPDLVLTPQVFVVALLYALAVAVVEEAVFRGFLLGSLASKIGISRALVCVSLVFSGVHLFRPGPPSFKLAYGVGLFLLALFLGRVAWAKNSIAASAGLHAGIILPNLLDPWSGLESGWWWGWRSEPSSGVLSWLLLLLLWGQWEWWRRRSQHTEDGP